MESAFLMSRDCFVPVSYTHLPVSKMSHTLTVESMEQEILSRDSFGSKRWIYPTNCMVMNYRISPEPENRITIFDCDEMCIRDRVCAVYVRFIDIEASYGEQE